MMKLSLSVLSINSEDILFTANDRASLPNQFILSVHVAGCSGASPSHYRGLKKTLVGGSGSSVHRELG